MSIRPMGLVAAFVTLFAANVSAADISGKWRAEFETPDGQKRQNTFTFKVDGDKLTGSVAGQAGEAPIQEGKVTGDEISFSVMRNFGGNEVKLQYKGKVAGDEIRLNVDFGGQGGFEMTAKRLPT